MIDGRGGDDQLNGYDGNDTLDGGGGNDTVFGGSGDDVMTGGHGDDMLQGLTGDDALYGESGNDHLAGGFGHDSLDGGAGDDMLIDTDLERDYLNGGDGNDSIHSYGADVLTWGGLVRTHLFILMWAMNRSRFWILTPPLIRWPFNFTKMMYVTFLYTQSQMMCTKFVWAIRLLHTSNLMRRLMHPVSWFKRTHRNPFANPRFFSIRA